MRKKLIAGAAVLALLMNAPQARADDDIVVFGGEFETEAPAPKKKPEPIKASPPEEPPAQIEEPPQIEQPLQEPEEPAPIEPLDKPPLQPADSAEEPATDEAFDTWRDDLVFDDLNNLPEHLPADEPVEELTPPAQIEQPVDEPFQPIEIEQPFQPVVIEPPPPQPVITTPQPFSTVEPARKLSTPERPAEPQKELKMLKPRFVKLAVDETYTYYLEDRKSVV